jgi:glutamyl-tRNA synthetase
MTEHVMTEYVGRYAPSPTGDLHLGNVLAAVCAWARARRAKGRFLLRMEDLDQPRVVEGAAARIVEDLERLGLDFDSGPGSVDEGAPYVQSQCGPLYDEALRKLHAAGRLYACQCSRKDLARLASAPHAGEEGPPYPGTCRELGLPLDDPSRPVSWRFRVEPGDVVIERKDGIVAYHLAVVVDDARQGVTEVVRGRDLLASAPRQVLLYRALFEREPAYAHIPLWTGPDGHRLAKRRGEGTLRALFDAGVTPEEVLGRIGRALGVAREGERLRAAALAERLSDEVLSVAKVTDDGPLPLE